MGAHRGQPFIEQLHPDISTLEQPCQCAGFYLCSPSRWSSGTVEGEGMPDHHCHRLFFDNQVDQSPSIALCVTGSNHRPTRCGHRAA